MTTPKRIEPKPGQESVWDYPRPPKLEPVRERIRVVLDNLTIADTRNALRILETSHPPTYYVPPEDVRAGTLVPARKRSMCEWKGQARYFDVVAGSKQAAEAAWSYPHPLPSFAALHDYVAFYAHAMDACFVGHERVDPQGGTFYGGWITNRIVGPFKGAAGSWGW
jgi:uncharacterized protein (DUF427 family)